MWSCPFNHDPRIGKNDMVSDDYFLNHLPLDPYEWIDDISIQPLPEKVTPKKQQ